MTQIPLAQTTPSALLALYSVSALLEEVRFFGVSISTTVDCNADFFAASESKEFSATLFFRLLAIEIIGDGAWNALADPMTVVE